MTDRVGIDYRRQNLALDPGARFDMDHVHCSQSAKVKADAAYVLLAPVPRGVNRAWATIERHLASDGKSFPPTTHTATLFTMAKLFGIAPPSIASGMDLQVQAKKMIDAMDRHGLLDGDEGAHRDAVSYAMQARTVLARLHRTSAIQPRRT